MIIQIDGTNTRNKGAELMLYAILEEIEQRCPVASVIFNTTSGDTKEIHTGLQFRQRLLLRYGKYPRSVLSRLQLPNELFSEFYPLRNIDVLLDASGFRFGDQWSHPVKYLNRLRSYYERLKQNNTSIILLPQAFGPFRTEAGKKSVDILNDYADLVIAREATSEKYLLEAGLKTEKLARYPDFTINAKGIFPQRYESIRKGVCIIPNQKMITHGHMSSEDYLLALHTIVTKIRERGEKVFLLNHEGEGDLAICRHISGRYDKPIPVITGLNAKEIKGIIGASTLVISSRYHGVASALNQGVPCIATSWSHKYELLFKDFGLTDYIIDLNENHVQAWQKIESLLDPATNMKMKAYLTAKKNGLKNSIDNMWNMVWQKTIKNN